MALYTALIIHQCIRIQREKANTNKVQTLLTRAKVALESLEHKAELESLEHKAELESNKIIL